MNPRVPRVLLASVAALPSPDRHGAELRNLLKALVPRFEVDVLLLKGPQQPVVERYMKARLLRVPSPTTGVGPAALAQQIETFRRAVRRQLEGDEYEIVHFRDAWSGLPICERKWDLPSCVVYDVALSPQGSLRPADAAFSASLRAEESYCLERADRIFVATETARRHLDGQGHGERVRVVPPGVDIDRFDWEPEPPPPHPVILYAGRIAPGRRVRLLLEACARLPTSDWELWLVGPIDHAMRESVAEKARTLGVHDNLRLLGPVDHDDIPRLCGQATICVVPHAPAVEEQPLSGPPIKLLEYMACKRPVVAPRRPCVSEVLCDGQEGLLFTPDDPADLAGCLGRLLTQSSLRERVAAAAYQAVRERFPASAARRRLLEAYAELLSPELYRPVTTEEGAQDFTPPPLDSTTARHVVPPADAVDSIGFQAEGALLPSGSSRKNMGESEKVPLTPDARSPKPGMR